MEEVDLGTGDEQIPDYKFRIRTEAKINELVREVNRLRGIIERLEARSLEGHDAKRNGFEIQKGA